MKTVLVKHVTSNGSTIEETTVLFYSLHSFTKKLAKHVCNPREPWQRILPGDSVEYWCTKVAGQPPIWRGSEADRQSAYDTVAQVIAAQLTEAAGAPRYIAYDEWLPGESRQHETGRFYLGNSGLIMVSRHHRVISAFFRQVVPSEAFTDAWAYLKRKSMARSASARKARPRSRCGDYEYYDREFWASPPLDGSVARAIYEQESGPVDGAVSRPDVQQVSQLRVHVRGLRESRHE